MTLREFLETYRGFDFENGEIVIVNQRTAKSYICEYKNNELKHPYSDFKYEMEMNVYKWTHSANTMLIVL